MKHIRAFYLKIFQFLEVKFSTYLIRRVFLMAKFRSGVAPLRLETSRYENLEINQRTCFNCCDLVESERRVLLHCPLYEDLQHEIYSQAFKLEKELYSFNDDKKRVFSFTSHNIIKTVAKACKDILDRRRRVLYK